MQKNNPHPTIDISTILNTELNNCCKGIPYLESPITIQQVENMGWNLLNSDLPTPLLTLSEDALRHNIRWMQNFVNNNNMLLAPHGKTTMSPQIFKQQLELGAWGMTAANINHLRVYREFGIQRIILANQLACAEDIRYITKQITQNPEFDFYCITDSIANLKIILKEWDNTKPTRPLQLLLEIGTPGGRTGCRALSEVLKVAQFIQENQDHFSLVGIEGYEGVITAKATPENINKITTYLTKIIDTTHALAEKKLFSTEEIIISVGGSAFFDLVATHIAQAKLPIPHKTILRAGCYVAHDNDWYQQFLDAMEQRAAHLLPAGVGLKATLSIWGSILSMPEPGMAILNFGKRDVPYDITLPTPQNWFRPEEKQKPQKLSNNYTLTVLYDQHALLSIPEDSPLQIGDIVGCGISHPCGAFDRWQIIPLINTEYEVTSAIKTYF